MELLNKNTILKRTDDVVFNTLDDEVIMMSIKNGEYYGLDSIGSWIWEKLEKPLTFDRLISIIMSDFEVTEDECFEDVREFLITMNE